MSTHKVAMAALLAVGLAATSHAGVLTFTDRTTFEAQGPVVHNYGFEDVGLDPDGFARLDNPWTAHGVTYTTGTNILVGPTSSWEPQSNVFAFGMWSPVTGSIDAAARYGMFGVDLGYLGEFESPITFTAFTNLGSYALTGLSVPNAGRGLNFYGFAASGGEYFTGFVISAESGTGGGVAPVIDNVTLGAPQTAPIPEPATVLLLGAGLLGLGASRRRRA